MTNEQLMEQAIKARENSCAKISGFKVGTALLDKGGKVFLGCNIEDPCGIGITNVCAERCVLIKALSEGYRDFEKIAVAGGMDELIFCAPCGACRQFMNSWCPDIILLLRDDDGKIKEFSISDLLPYSFSETF